jgi:hypothetical protein
MPVGFEIRENTLYVRQSFDFPAVYLDHWAIRHFSSNDIAQQRFLGALKLSGGCLVVSHATLLEITGPEDPRHSLEIAGFLEQTLPDIYFALFDMKHAINQEKQHRDMGIRLMAPPDLELLKTVARERPNDLQPFTIADIIKTISNNRAKLGATWRASNQRTADRLNEVRRDPEFNEKAKRFAGHPINVPTLAVFQEMLRPVLQDDTFGIDRNDAGDIHHAIISLVYCDLVLLDAKWEDFHDRMKRRFAELGLIVRTARVYSARRDGISRFLDALSVAKSPSSTERGVLDTRK